MKLMKIIGIVILILTAIIVGVVLFIKHRASNLKDKKNLELAIDKQVNKYITDGNSYGLVVGVVKNDKVYLKGYGTIDKGKSILPDSLTTFELASTSKLFTTSTLQILVDEGILNLDDKIQTILGSNVNLPIIAQNTTLRHLATHLSGFPSLPNSFITKMTDETNPYKSLRTQDIYDYLKTCENKQKDGTYEYSNFGMGLLGHLLELKTGKKYEQLVKEKLLNPIGMTQTFVTIDSFNKQKIIHGFDENGKPAPIWEDNVLNGAGSFLSNGNDMIKFIKSNLNKSETIISKSLLATHNQQLNGETGLGWILPTSTDKFLGNKNIIWHNGMAGAYSSFIAIDKVNNYGIFILSNKAVDVTNLGMKLTLFVRTQSWKE